MKVDAPLYVPLSPAQMAIWTGQKIHPDVPIYNEALIWKLSGSVNTQIFQKCFQKLVNLTDSLRLTFHELKDGPVQCVEHHLNYKVEVIDWTNKTVEERDVLEWADIQTTTIFDITKRNFDSILIKTSPKTFYWFLNEHHLITDATTQSLIFERMTALYSDMANGRDIAKLEYPKYWSAIKIQHKEKGKLNDRIYNYWDHKVANSQRIRRIYGLSTKTTSTTAKRLSLELDPELSHAIRALARAEGSRLLNDHISHFNIFSALLFAFLHRVSTQEEITIGTPLQNRPTKESKDTAGLFIEIFPLQTKLDSSKPFKELLTENGIEILRVLKNVAPGISGLQWSSAYNVIINYITSRYTTFNNLPTTTNWIHSKAIDYNHALRLQVHDFNDTGCFQLHFDLNSGIFNEYPWDRIPTQFLRLAESLIANPETPIGRPALETSPRKDAITHDGMHNLTLLDSFKQQVEARTDEVALAFNGQSISYGELDFQTNAIAAYLKKNFHLKKGDRVGIYLKRSPRLVASIIGILKAGGTYVPLATNYPAKRVQNILDDAKVALLISESKQIETLSTVDLPTLDLTGEWDSVMESPPEPSRIVSEPDDLIYIMYTSGSTGSPKGVMVEQKSLMNYLNWAKKEYKVDTSTNIPLFSSVAFDLTVTSLFLPLLCGGKMIIYPENESGADLSILKVMEDDRANFIKLTPSHLRLYLERNFSRSKLKTIVVGGEKFDSGLANATLKSIGGHIALYNEYGPTEATVGCVFHKIQNPSHETSTLPIGVPIDNCQAYILDDFLNEVPQNVPGKLFISGLPLARGYWGDEQLTNEKFISDPRAPFLITYNTGDIARYNLDGKLEFLGRSDDQVKIGGHRVELGEIESVSNNHPDVSGSFVHLMETASPNIPVAVKYCLKCGLPSNYPQIKFNPSGVCNICTSFDAYKEKVKPYFKDRTQLTALFEKVRNGAGDYDCIMLLSGGKDSTYALAQLVEMNLRVLAYTLDNGYISDQAKVNIKRVVNSLGVDHIFGQTPAMNEIFKDSLKTFSNVCNGCFKTIYTLSTKLALEKQIPFIVTGLSRGQFFETRLTEELFWNKVDISEIDQTILEARKAYHRTTDAVSRLIGTRMFQQDETFEKVQFVDFYRYSDVSLEEMMAYLDAKLPWVRPTDTGRSTNCLINKVGIYTHKKKLGYNNYAFPYSWDVRVGHKTREEALEEINEEIDESEVKQIMSEIGYNDADNEETLVMHYAADEDIPKSSLTAYLQKHLPDYMIPVTFIRWEDLPLTPNGKIDKKALIEFTSKHTSSERKIVKPSTEIEERIAEIWSEVLGRSPIGVTDNLLELGGQSLDAIRIIARLNESLYLNFPINAIFEDENIRNLSRRVENYIRTQLNN